MQTRRMQARQKRMGLAIDGREETLPEPMQMHRLYPLRRVEGVRRL